MSKIHFSQLPPQHRNDVIAIFNELKQSKEKNTFDSEKIKKLLGEKYFDKFWHPTEAEIKKWDEKWKKLDPEQKHLEALNTPWHFESWISAFENAEIQLIALDVNADGTGFLEFNELSFPSGGVAAIEYIVKVFDAEITSNDAIMHNSE